MQGTSMTKRPKRPRTLGVAGAGLALAVATTTMEAPQAEAYRAGFALITTVTTSGSCASAGPLEVHRVAGACHLPDQADHTSFRSDPGGRAVKIEFRSGGELRAKGEFHPYAERFWVYDTSSDGDTIYFSLTISGVEKLYRAPEGRGHRVYDLDVEEGQPVLLRAYDEAGGQDALGEGTGLA